MPELWHYQSCHEALEGPLAWVVCTHYLSRIPKMKSPWVANWVIWVAMEAAAMTYPSSCELRQLGVDSVISG
jgi:hypothetical protein